MGLVIKVPEIEHQNNLKSRKNPLSGQNRIMMSQLGYFKRVWIPYSKRQFLQAWRLRGAFMLSTFYGKKEWKVKKVFCAIVKSVLGAATFL